ncbi:MAG: SEL1-like repeat protein [Xanthomonadales bacterium]|jgi:hypothetical protein|nr:SEL1-like repeat protein [Xanthomonadales bacterium]
MKKYTFLILFFISSIVNADLISATKNYEEQNFNEAFNQFMVLAKLGNINAQHNIAVLYYNGEGTAKDLEKAYAWSVISDSENDNYQQLTSTIKSKLSKEQLESAEVYAIELEEDYSYENSKLLLGPKTDKADKDSNIKTKSVEIVKTAAPYYPRNMLSKGIQGFADIQFYVYPNGSIKDFQVLEEFPSNNEFAREAIKSIQKYKFRFNPDKSGNYRTEPYLVTQRINFAISGHEERLHKSQKVVIDKILENAKNGDVGSQYSYAVLYDTLLERKSEIDGGQITDWLFNASQEGNIDAQFRLGKKIYYGKDCKIEKQKGVDWVMNSAQIGNVDAQYMAYQMLNNSQLVNQSGQTAFYWLEQSALNGLLVAQLKYSEVIASSDNPTEEQIDLAETFLNKYKDKLFKTIQWYEVNAMLQNTKGNYSKALKSIDTAIKNAKKAEWDLSELNKQKELIIKNKNSA